MNNKYNLGIENNNIFYRFANRAMIKNETIDSLLTAQNIREIHELNAWDNVRDGDTWQKMYMLCLEIVEDMVMHGVPRGFFTEKIEEIAKSLPLSHHVKYGNSEAIALWESKAESGETMRII